MSCSIILFVVNGNLSRTSESTPRASSSDDALRVFLYDAAAAPDQTNKLGGQNMAFLGRPSLGLNTPSRPSPTSPGTVRVDIAIPLFFERLEGCFVRACPDALRDPIYQIQAEVWSSDVNEPIGTFPMNAPNAF